MLEVGTAIHDEYSTKVDQIEEQQGTEGDSEEHFSAVRRVIFLAGGRVAVALEKETTFLQCSMQNIR